MFGFTILLAEPLRTHSIAFTSFFLRRRFFNAMPAMARVARWKCPGVAGIIPPQNNSRRSERVKEHQADASKFEGALLGLAIGDALGMPYEGWRPPWILSRVGGKVREFRDRSSGGLTGGQWTDDTKMALALAGSIVRSGGVFVPADAAKAYLEWFESGDLRGIGNTCLESILRIKNGAAWEESGKTGKMAAGNGTAMRVAPIGLLHCLNMEALKETTREDALITHNNEEAVAGSRAVAYLVARGVTTHGFGTATVGLIDDVTAFIGECEVARRLEKAKGLFVDKTPISTALQKLGTGGYVVETVASAVFCFLSTPSDFEETVVNAVMGGGDADTTAAVAGAISGAWNGTWNLPRRWVDKVEGSDEIRAVAGKLYEAMIKDSR